MRSVEATGKTKEEAVAEAARMLGVEPDRLTVELLEESKKLLGLFAGHEVKIRASVPDEQADEAVPDGPQDEPQAPASDGHEAGDDEALQDDSGAAANYACEVLDEILSRMTLDAAAQLQAAGKDEIAIDIVGADAKQLIGRHGETLNALQLLTGIIISRRFTGVGRIAIDAEGYREQRRRMLERMAHQHAEQAKEAGKEIVVKDLKPHERRIVHLALRDDPEIETYSEGEGDDRYLVISPIIE
jgi:spoIIIJ-associated protein